MAMPSQLRERLIKITVGLLTAGAISYGTYQAANPAVDANHPAIVLAMEMGALYESGGRHIGKPYRDAIGKGQPWTVCNGITGPEVDPSRYYTPEDCKRLELPRYIQAFTEARRHLKFWDQYNVFVQASFIDMIFNLGITSLRTSTAFTLANNGNLDGACMQMPRWVYGTVEGARVKLAGLVGRRETSRELCAEWGRNGRMF